MAKNKHYEAKFQGQRLYGAKPTQRLENGIVVRHCYDGEPKPLSWWDDTGFNLNGKRVMIWWTHPRMDFNDAISDKAYENVPYPGDEENMFQDSDKIYKYVGKSGKRKKILAYRCNPAPNKRQWYDALKAEEDRLKKVTDIEIIPNYTVEILDWCRGVSICCPLEVKGIPDLHILCALVKKLLKGETTLDKEFPNYKYTKDDWNKEINPETTTMQIHNCG